MKLLVSLSNSDVYGAELDPAEVETFIARRIIDLHVFADVLVVVTDTDE